MNEKITKRSIIFIISDILVLIIVLGIAYATFSYAKPGTKVNKIIAGAITMSYTESSNKISIANATPMSDTSGEAMAGDGEYFDFTISTNMTTSQPISYEVTAEKDNESTLADDEVRLYLEKYETESAIASGESIEYEEVFSPIAFTPIDSEDATGEDSLGAKNTEMLLDTGEITTDKTVYYRLRMWVAEGYTHTQEAKTYEVTVNVYGKDVTVEGANGINLSKKSLTMQKGETKQISAEVTPSSAKNKNLIWTSLNQSVIKVDSSGNITAVGVGTAIVRVQTSDKRKTAECTVTVVDADAESVSLNTESVTLVRGSTNQLTATVLPVDASDKSVTWSSASNGVATVSSTGLVTAVGIGVTTITVETVNGKTATVEVTVVAPTPDTITISGPNTVDIGSTTQLSVANASGETSGEVSSLDLVWSSSDTSKATVSSNGLVTGIGAGSVTITASVREYPDIYATKQVTIQQPSITSITMSSDITIDSGNTAIFTISYLPSNAGNIEDIEWISSNTEVATVDCDGQTYCEIEGLAGGSTTITARTTNAIYATATLTVNQVIRATDFAVGDYVQMTPSYVGSYTPTKDSSSSYYTGTSNPGSVTPSELTKWVVIKDLSTSNIIEIMSLNVSSTNITVYGLHINKMGAILNKISEQYSNDIYTNGYRGFGYVEGCNLEVKPSYTGGSDNCYNYDLTLINDAIGSTSAKSNNGTYCKYFTASTNISQHLYQVKYVDTNGTIQSQNTSNSGSAGSVSASIRPILSLKPTAKALASGDGSSNNPWVLVE